MVAFTVYKSSKYLFDCVGATDTAPRPYPTVDLDALEALRLSAVDVVKRMDYAELDKLIACCRQHPPQTIVVPATHGDIAPFQGFAKYLKVRQRAGVVIIADERLLILAPLENDDSRLRCVVVKMKSTTEPSVALSSNASAVRVNEAIPGSQAQTETQAQAVNAQPPQVPDQTSEKRRRVRSRNRARKQQDEVAFTEHQGLSTVSDQSNPSDVASVSAPNEERVMLYNLPRIEKATKIAQIRQEYEAFNELHYEVLRKWSKSDPDS